MVNALFAYDLFKLLGHFLCMLLMKVINVTLVSHLRPAADFGSVRLSILYLVTLDDLSTFHENNVCGIRIGRNDRECRIFSDQSHERKNIRSLEHKHSVFIERYFE